MKIVFFPYRLVVCGTVVNAIDLAAAVRDQHGHDVLLFATPGPLLERAAAKGLRVVEAPPAELHPSPARIRALRALVRRERPDLIHAWDWHQCLDAYLEHLATGVPLVATDMEMRLGGILPKALPTTYGTPELVDLARASGHRAVDLLLPPVDVHENAPGAVDGRAFRARHGVLDGELAVVTVSRLDGWLKAESLRRSIAALRELPAGARVKLLLVGDGDVRAELEREAAAVNAALGRTAVVLTGALVDPRPAYAAADLVVGMGGSALRGMAFGKPVVIVGERGFAATFGPETAPTFLYRGMYGTGDGSPANDALVAAIAALAASPDARAALGRFARELVVERFSLESVSARLVAFYEAARAAPRRLDVAALDGLRTAAVWVRQRRFLPPGWRTRVRAMVGLPGR